MRKLKLRDVSWHDRTPIQIEYGSYRLSRNPNPMLTTIRRKLAEYLADLEENKQYAWKTIAGLKEAIEIIDKWLSGEYNSSNRD